MRSFSLPLSDCGLTQAEFYEFFEFLLYRGFGLMSEFSCWNLWHENGHGFAEYIFCPYISLVREIAAALRRPRNCSGASPPANIAAALRRPQILQQ